MGSSLISPEELVSKLCELTGLDQKTLAKKIGVSEQTLSGWSNNPRRRIAPQSINKIGEAMKQNNWNIKLGTVTRSKIEIITTTNDAIPTVPQNDKLKDSFIEIAQENFQLRKENDILKEKLFKYEVKK